MVNISLICQVMEKNYQQLPNKQVYRMVKVLRKARQRGEMSGAEN